MTDLGDFTNLVNDTINGVGQSGSTGGIETPEVKVTGVSLNKTSTTIALNGTETLTATVTPDNASNKNITWASSDESVATVENGTVTALKVGTATITATAQDGSGVSASCAVTINPTLTSQITGADYGKAIDYSVTVKNSSNEDITLSNWRVFYNDKTENKVYIIYDGYLPKDLIPSSTGMATSGTYQAYWDETNFSTNEEAVATLKNTTYWSAFAGGVTDAIAYGGPTNAMFVNSWNENPSVNETTLLVETATLGLTDTSKLYIPYTSVEQGCSGYWLALPRANFTNSMWRVNYNGEVGISRYGSNYNYGLRPLVCLPSELTGTVGNSVNMNN